MENGATLIICKRQSQRITGPNGIVFAIPPVFYFVKQTFLRHSFEQFDLRRFSDTMIAALPSNLFFHQHPEILPLMPVSWRDEGVALSQPLLCSVLSTRVTAPCHVTTH